MKANNANNYICLTVKSYMMENLWNMEDCKRIIDECLANIHVSESEAVKKWRESQKAHLSSEDLVNRDATHPFI